MVILPSITNKGFMGFIRVWIFLWWIAWCGCYGPIEVHHALCIPNDCKSVFVYTKCQSLIDDIDGDIVKFQSECVCLCVCVCVCGGGGVIYSFIYSFIRPTQRRSRVNLQCRSHGPWAYVYYHPDDNAEAVGVYFSTPVQLIDTEWRMYASVN